tara:strand:- start:19945 stop:20400 length:456 start_codon:yes stop_codon:yes gene_type:complete
MIAKQTCKLCERPLPLTTNFYSKDRKSSTGFRTVCKHCARRRRNLKLDRRRRKILGVLSSQGCIDCNERNPLLLEFDHVIGDKEFCISDQFLRKPWDVIEEEIEKCVVRCKNCHAIKTIIEHNHYHNLPEREYWIKEYYKRLSRLKGFKCE